MEILVLMSAGVSLITLIIFFVMASNISKMRKLMEANVSKVPYEIDNNWPEENKEYEVKKPQAPQSTSHYDKMFK